MRDNHKFGGMRCPVSDFGAHVAVYRADDRPPSAEDVQRVRAAARSLQFTRPDRIGPYDEFDIRFGGATGVGGVEGVGIFLSGHMVGDDVGNDGLDPEAIIAREASVAERFGEDLERALGGEFRVEPYSGYH